jgi:hypothetical protein
VQAGAHSNLVSRLGFSDISQIDPCDCHVVKDVFVNMPPGVIGTPTNLPTCSEADITAGKCPVDSQVGLIAVSPWNAADFSSGSAVPLYNMQPSPREVARLAFPVPGSASNSVNIAIVARTESDYGLEFHTFGIPRILPSSGYTLLNWGVPGDSVNDEARFSLSAEKAGGCSFPGMQDVIEAMLAEPPLCGNGSGPPVSSNAALTPFLNNPTSCSGPLRVTGEILGYDNETDFAEATFPLLTGCDQLTFDPSLSANPTTTEAESPSGLDVNLTVPQKLAADALTPSAIRAVTLTLPPGFSVNANAADGKTACTAADANFGTRKQAQCPENSKIGTLEVESSSLPSLLPGAMYLGEPLPGERYRVFFAFDGFSLHVKIAGTAYLDPATGRVKFTMKDMPQFNFQRFSAHVFGAERGIFGTPSQCGTYPVEATYRPWAYPDLPDQTSTQFFSIDSGPNGSPCPPALRPFNPTMAAGVTDNTGGADTDLVFDLNRNDGDQSLAATSVTLPPGLTAVIAGVPYCPESSVVALGQSSYLGAAELRSPACPTSRIGTTYTSAGAGSRPVSLPGSAYLAGPYRGEPLSLAIVVPVVTGPYDLGNVVTRVALHVDPTTAQVTAISDPLPQIIEGVPVRLRRILVLLDRPNFALNPTNCSPLSINAQVTGDQGSLASLSNHFQVANCGVLPFHPKLRFRVSGSTKQAGNPALTATLTAKPGEANISRVQVTLPRTELVDNAHIRTVCTRVQFIEGQNPGERCPPGSVLGFARAETPLLANPLKGPIYLRSTGRAGLPDVVAALNGQIDIVLDGHVDSVHRRLRAIFRAVPDAPVTKAVFSFDGGHKGLIENSPRLCSATQHVKVQMTGQNGKSVKRNLVLTTACGRASKRHRHHKRHRSHRKRLYHSARISRASRVGQGGR